VVRAMHSDDLAYLASTSLRPGSARYIDPATGGFTSHPAGKSGSEVETGPRLPRSHLAPTSLSRRAATLRSTPLPPL